MSFEDPTQLFKCTRVDCNGDRAGGTPFCARHLREQETASPGYCEPELEARLARTVRTEDDDHPGEKKIYHDDGTSEWVPDADYQPPRPASRLYVGPDPDTANGFHELHQAITEELHRGAGVWVAYHTDWSGFAIFDDEVAALRHAVTNSMSVGLATFGQELGGGRYPGPRSSPAYGQ